MRPKYESSKQGSSSSNNWENADEIDFSSVYVANSKDSAATINSKLDSGLHILLQPGIYNLDQALVVKTPGTVVLGIGMATLVATNGNSLIEVEDVNGVRIAGVVLEAGPKKSDTLIRVGTKGFKGDATQPPVISDVFARVGGRNDSNKS